MLTGMTGENRQLLSTVCFNSAGFLLAWLLEYKESEKNRIVGIQIASHSKQPQGNYI